MAEKPVDYIVETRQCLVSTNAGGGNTFSLGIFLKMLFVFGYYRTTSP
ncbi:hypothetical protein KAR34_04175 [bacterium]|nr:hypothetical protein [bacterium]